MRSWLSLLLLATGCHYDFWREPRGPSSSCSGGAVAWGNTVSGGESCESFPPDRCNPAHESYANDMADGTCDELASARREHNEAVRSQEVHDWILAGVVSAILAGAIVGACLLTPSCSNAGST